MIDAEMLRKLGYSDEVIAGMQEICKPWYDAPSRNLGEPEGLADARLPAPPRDL